MAKAYSMDLRERVLKDCDTGMRSEDVAQKYSVSASWVYDLRKKRRETGSIAPKQQRHGSRPKLEPYEKEVRQLVSEHPDATLAEFCEMLSQHVSVSTATLCDFLRHLKITRKKDSLRRRTASRRYCFPASRMGQTLRVHRHEKTRVH